ncbi:TIGR00255 family protein [Sphingobacterium spiritivorum ATCC 33300]|uniref:TIGR00255 family protein n=2 Tax=Sphingobacterium spiritivorum TaxID=258 RepID=C2G1M3_SPHSI|nr:YicC/YloC family endoribonuclease [Sphingobacterium spiritivorum]EEI90932.1 TIGR00255 family protein [Sphingobacterium spiritivorum ATCC 33300]QQS97816.1 YicC family protein [Sphingobacterium spiritivorum]
MIKSMTGYGIGTHDNEKVKYSVEIKSLNSKFLELNIRLPKAVSDKELTLRGECGKLIERGKVNVMVNVEYTDQTAKASNINAALLKKYYEQLQDIALELGDKQASLFALALDMPEVVTNNDDTVDEEEGGILMAAFKEAVNQFNIFREKEGVVLRNDLEQRVQFILDYLTSVEAKETSRIPLIRERISQYMDEVVGKENIDKNRFEQELIYYIDKLDITEEKVRLRSHCNYFLEALNAPDSNGKKLGFISQEMGREINTLGSKANNAEIQQIVVRMKEELEKIKEQLLNVL